MPAGTYKLTIASSALNDPSNGDLDVKNNASIAVTGAGSASTTIDANGVDRAFAVQLGSALSLSRLTIANGNAAAASSGFLAGGAIYSDGGLSVSGDVLFSHNSAGNGGAIYADSGVGSTLTLTGATFDHNSSDNGGAVFDSLPSSGTASISNSIFTNNTTSSGGNFTGGAIDGQAGALSVTGSQFTGNHSDDGGAISWSPRTAVSITGSSFHRQHSGDPGRRDR